MHTLLAAAPPDWNILFNGLTRMDNVGFLLFLMCIAVTIITVSVLIFLHCKRNQLIKHEERMAMIRAGIHSDYPPGEVPAEAKSVVPQETSEYSRTV